MTWDMHTVAKGLRDTRAERIPSLANSCGTRPPAANPYCDRIATHFRLPNAATLKVRTPGWSGLGLARVRTQSLAHGPTSPIPREDAFVVVLHLQPTAPYRFRIRGEEVEAVGFEDGRLSIVHLMDDPVWDIAAPFDALHLYIPRAALNKIADDCDIAPITTLLSPAGQIDPIARQLVNCLLPVLETPGAATTPFVDYVILALLAHVARTYGDVRTETRPARGGLTPRQERRATELLLSRIEGGGGLAEVAKEVGLSLSHFSRTFKESFGVPPHRWLAERRLEQVKQLIAETDMPLAEIAIMCGFSDQPYLTRVFSRAFGKTPAVWRKTVQ